MTELQKRAAATQATEKRFRGKPFAWDRRATCIHLFSFHARQMGHNLPLVPRFRSALGAMRALKAQGVETLPELLDKYFPRIAPAYLQTGDIACTPGEDMDALYVYGDLRAFLGWHISEPDCTVCRFSDEAYSGIIGAWRL